MPALRIFERTRASRCAIVGTGTRNARAISVVDSPPTVCSISATCASSASVGWQQVNMSLSCSSGIAGATNLYDVDFDGRGRVRLISGQVVAPLRTRAEQATCASEVDTPRER